MLRAELKYAKCPRTFDEYCTSSNDTLYHTRFCCFKVAFNSKQDRFKALPFFLHSVS